MTHREQTVQQLDPLAGVNGREVTVFGAVAVVIYAIVMTFLNRDDIDIPWLAVAAIAVLAVDGVAAGRRIQPAASPAEPHGARARDLRSPCWRCAQRDLDVRVQRVHPGRLGHDRDRRRCA